MLDRLRITDSLGLVALGLATSATIAAPSIASASLRARPASILSVRDTAHLRYIARESEGSTLVEEGSAGGQLPGAMRARLTVGASSFTGRFSLRTRGGSIIKGYGSAKPSGGGRYQSFAGSLVVTGGTGRYVHAHGKAGLYGVFDRQTYGLTIQTTGRLSY
jgi:hypothetical protein